MSARTLYLLINGHKGQYMKDIKNYEGLYAVTEEGQVWSYYKKRFLNPYKDAKGYLRVDLYKEGSKKTFKIHRLVAETYIPNPDNLPDVGHNDDTKENNFVSNLYWTEPKENNNHGSYPQKISQSLKGNSRAGKKIICVETGEIYESAMEAYRCTNINNGSISHVLNGRAKTAGGYHWRYIDE